MYAEIAWEAGLMSSESYSLLRLGIANAVIFQGSQEQGKSM